MGDIQTKIISTYTKISHFVFHYLIFLVALIVAFLLFQQLLRTSSTRTLFQTNDTLLAQKSKIIAAFNKFLQQDINDKDVKLYILQWDFEREKGFIKSSNNLITYKWFVLPKYFYMYNTIPLKPIDYFADPHYSPDELETFVNNVVFTKKFITPQPFIHTQLPLETTLVEDFNLGCLFENKFSHSTCNYYFQEFLSSFFVYKLSMDYPGLTQVFDRIQHTPTDKWAFCEWLSKYLLYTNDYNDTIKSLFVSCGKTYEDLFKQTTLFMDIQKTLDDQSFETISYKDPLLNAYKLLSYQQQLYQDFLINKADYNNIRTYLDFVKQLLQKNTIPSFYKDEIYRYNNKYLALSLENLTYQSSRSLQTMGESKISSLLTTIISLNEGESMFGFTGLQYQLTNLSLIPPVDIFTWTDSTTNITERIQTKLKNISYLTIEKQSISNRMIDIIAYIPFYSPTTNETVKAHIIMEYVDDMLLVQSIELQNKPEMNDVIKNLLLIQDFSLGELYSYIAKNLVFYEQDNAPISASTDVCPDLQQLENITLVSCTNTLVIIEKNDLLYEFTLKNGGIENINISDKVLENAIKTSYTSIIAKSYTLSATLSKLLQYTPSPVQHQWTTNAILVFERIQEYLGIKANDIADKDNRILVDLSLGGINFIVEYTLDTHTLWPRYFKDILVKGSPYIIQDFDLPLDEKHQNTINAFVIDPLTTIKNIDLTAWQNYNAFLQTHP